MMIEELASNLYKIEVPLPRSLLRSVNCYLIKGSERLLLIDTGMNEPECLEAIRHALRQLDADLTRTDFFITHFHPDHIGSVSELAAATSTIYFNKKESLVVKRADLWTRVRPAFFIFGFDKNEIGSVKQMFSAVRYRPKADIVFYPLSEGATITAGDYSLTCIETPGHSPGHLCLYDATKKLLFSGDHVLGDISPNISGVSIFFGGGNNPLKSYLESLDKIYAVEVSLVLPGHRSPFRDHQKRIHELKQHHEMRLREILSILRNEDGLSVYQIAARMTWEIDSQWADFPVTQKWFAAGEAFSHLLYLEDTGHVKKQTAGEVLRYSF